MALCYSSLERLKTSFFSPFTSTITLQRWNSFSLPCHLHSCSSSHLLSFIPQCCADTLALLPPLPPVSPSEFLIFGTGKRTLPESQYLPGTLLGAFHISMDSWLQLLCWRMKKNQCPIEEPGRPARRVKLGWVWSMSSKRAKALLWARDKGQYDWRMQRKDRKDARRWQDI